jgi:hypothetical protein
MKVSIVVDILLLQTVSIAIASSGVFAAAIYYLVQVRHQTRTRDLDSVTRLTSLLLNKEFQEANLQVRGMKFVDYEDFKKKYGSFSSGPLSAALHMVFGFYEQLGVLCHRKLVDINLIDELIGGAALWEKGAKLIAEGARKEFDDPTMYEWFEYYYNEMKKREQRK